MGWRFPCFEGGYKYKLTLVVKLALKMPCVPSCLASLGYLLDSLAGFLKRYFLLHLSSSRCTCIDLFLSLESLIVEVGECCGFLQQGIRGLVVLCLFL